MRFALEQKSMKGFAVIKAEYYQIKHGRVVRKLSMQLRSSEPRTTFREQSYLG